MQNNEHILEFFTKLDFLFIVNLLKIENIDRKAKLIQNTSNNKKVIF